MQQTDRARTKNTFLNLDMVAGNVPEYKDDIFEAILFFFFIACAKHAQLCLSHAMTKISQ